MARGKSTATRTIRVENPLGLHARPCSLLVQTASHFTECDVFAGNGRQKVNAKSIMGVLGLAAGQGVNLQIEATGRRAGQAVEAVCRLIAELEKFEQYATREETMDAWRELMADVTGEEKK